eukprot:TRINITY_DN55515_c0_g1_i1.p1 TRINITY_DN55515_c0_g1~~TRINITY_DN55515_c0_g1_i1.p1  ORF type:complete len:512 (-),score=85.91 TRINITY_DN55515_c0_g1_i1:104-1639(-)
MVRVKLILELSYLGTKYIGWQTQLPPAATATTSTKGSKDDGGDDGDEKDKGETQNGATAEGSRSVEPALKHPCKRYNKGRCRRGGGCWSAHICALCWRRHGLRLPHAACDAACPDDSENSTMSVQDALDRALRLVFTGDDGDKLRQVLRAPPSGLIPSGRTDRGVHARRMVATCNCHIADASEDGPLSAAVAGLSAQLNAKLPSDIRCRNVTWTSELNFNARTSARKTYTYYLAEAMDGQSKVLHERLGELGEGVWLLETSPPLDLDAMRKAATALVGQHDFLSFCSVPPPQRQRQLPPRARRRLDHAGESHSDIAMQDELNGEEQEQELERDGGMPAADAKQASAGGNIGSTVRQIFSVDVLSSPMVTHIPFDLLGTCYHAGRAVGSAACPSCSGGAGGGQGQGEAPPGSPEDAGVRLLAVRVTGDGFLKHMVRRIVGFLVEVGRGRASAASASDLLLARFDGTSCAAAGSDGEVAAAPTGDGWECIGGTWRTPRAPARGLWLEDVQFSS